MYREISQPQMTFSYAVCLQLAAFYTPKATLFVMTRWMYTRLSRLAHTPSTPRPRGIFGGPLFSVIITLVAKVSRDFLVFKVTQRRMVPALDRLWLDNTYIKCDFLVSAI